MSTQLIELGGSQADYSKYRDISESDKRLELAARVAMAVAVVLVLTGTIVGIRHLQNSFQVVITKTGLVRYVSLAPLGILPGIFGTAAIVGLILGIYFLNMEKIRYGEERRSLKEEHQRAERLFELRKSNLDNLYLCYYKKNGGLGPLVRNGILTIEQKERVSQMLSAFGTHRAIVLDWTSPQKDKEFVEMVKANPGNPAYHQYHASQKIVAELEKEWAEFRETIGAAKSQDVL